MTYRLSVAGPADWVACEPHLLAALAHTKDWVLEDVALAALRGQVTLWKVTREDAIVGAGASVVTRYAKRLVMDILLFAGEGFPDLLADLQEIARSCGCSALTGRGRKGWLRALKGAQTIPVWELEV